MCPVAPDAVATVALDGPYSVKLALPGHGHTIDPTYVGRPDSVHFAARTPAGPVSVRARTASGTLRIEAWGDGAGWVVGRADRIAAHHDDPRPLRFGDDRIDDLNRRHPGLRHAAHGCVVDGLLARIHGQRVLAVEAGRSWAALCRELGDDAPGPLGLRLPPDHERLANSPTWWFHQHGVERGRARTMVAVARNAHRLSEVVDVPLPEAYGRMRAMPGLGPWTVNGVARTALGDPDAIIVGDYWFSHAVCSFFTGRPRGSDEEMLALVERWAGQRGRVERLVHLSGHRVQRFAPGRPTPRIARL
jgi:3-methyladenine DNA glycosylase/8-oxoguanine DNA glycosylase